MDALLSISPLFLPMLGFMFVAAFTPGPNNIMLAVRGEFRLCPDNAAYDRCDNRLRLPACAGGIWS